MIGRIRAAVNRFQQRHAWVAFPYAVFKKFGEDRAGEQAALLAYYGFFSLFPLLLFAVTILGMVLRDNRELQDEILSSALAQFPIIGEQIRENLGSFGRSGAALVVGLVGALWAGLAGIKALQNAMDHIWDIPIRKQPGIPVRISRGALILVVLGAFVILTTGLAAVGANAGGAFFPVRAATLAASLLLNTVVFLAIFKLLTVADISWRDVFPGAVVASVAWTALQALGNYFVRTRLANASEMYGFFGIVLGLLSWMYIGGQVTLLSAEINVVRKIRAWPRSLAEDELTEADKRALRRHAKVEERVDQETVDVGFEGREEPDRPRALP